MFQWKKNMGLFVPTLLSPSFWEVMFHLLQQGRFDVRFFHEANFQIVFPKDERLTGYVDSRSSSGSSSNEIQKGQKQKW